jgi:alpha-galactosidase
MRIVWNARTAPVALATALLLFSGCRTDDPPPVRPDTDSTSGSSSATSTDTQSTDTDSSTWSDSDSDSETQTQPDPVELKGCDSGSLVVSSSGLAFEAPCEGSALELWPYVRIGDTWYGGGDHGACAAESESLRCPAAALGDVVATVSGNTVELSFDAKADVVVRGLSLRGSMSLPDARGWLSNGLQSWSMSGVITLAAKPSEAQLNAALAETGEDEVYRKGRVFSNWHTFAGGGALSFFAGVKTAQVFRSYAQVHKEGNQNLYVALASGGVERVTAKAGTTVKGEPWLVYLGEDLEAYQRIYGSCLESRKRSSPLPVPAGWNSWYDLWDDVKQTDILNAAGNANADLAASALGPMVPEANQPLWIVVDDGWQKSWGDWTPNSKFPGGLSAMAASLSGMGLRMGLWLAPLLVAPGSDTAKAHPQWLVQGATFTHPVHGDMRVLDVTHPQAAEYLKDLFATLVEAGIGLLKIDFLFAGALEGTRQEALTGIQAYHRALALIREGAGEDALLLAVGAPPIPSFPYVDGWRVGNDIAFKPLPVIDFPQPTWTFIANQARSIASRYSYCLATLCDPDPPLLRVLPRHEVEAGLWVAASTGGAFFLSDDLRQLESNRLTWFSQDIVDLSLSAAPAVPESFFPDLIPDTLKSMKDEWNLFKAEHQVPSIWRFQDGRRMAINFNDSPKKIEGVSVPAHTAVDLQN